MITSPRRVAGLAPTRAGGDSTGAADNTAGSDSTGRGGTGTLLLLRTDAGGTVGAGTTAAGGTTVAASAGTGSGDGLTIEPLQNGHSLRLVEYTPTSSHT